MTFQERIVMERRRSEPHPQLAVVIRRFPFYRSAHIPIRMAATTTSICRAWLLMIFMRAKTAGAGLLANKRPLAIIGRSNDPALFSNSVHEIRWRTGRADVRNVSNSHIVRFPRISFWLINLVYHLTQLGRPNHSQRPLYVLTWVNRDEMMMQVVLHLNHSDGMREGAQDAEIFKPSGVVLRFHVNNELRHPGRIGFRGEVVSFVTENGCTYRAQTAQ